MYLAPEGQELEIAEAARIFLTDAIPLSRLQKAGSADMNAAQMKSIADLGWFGLAVPEECGGSGLSAIEHSLFFREVGRQCGPSGILAQSLAANATNSEALRLAFLRGETACALIVQDRDQYRIFGASDATHGVLATRETAFIYDISTLLTEARPNLDPSDSMRLCKRLSEPLESRPGPKSWIFGQLGAAAMLIGIAEAALDLIVDYAKVRETFGKKIGAWQAVRHPCADMAVRLEAARSQLWFAAAACKEDRSDARVHLDAAKHLCNYAGYRNADANIQLHGGIGVTEEHNAHFLLKRSLLLGRLFGSRHELLRNLLTASLVD